MFLTELLSHKLPSDRRTFRSAFQHHRGSTWMHNSSVRRLNEVPLLLFNNTVLYIELLCVSAWIIPQCESEIINRKCILCVHPRCQFQQSALMYFYFVKSRLLDTQVDSSTSETMCKSGYLPYAVLCGMRQLSSCAVLRSQPEAAKSCCIVLRMDVWYMLLQLGALAPSQGQRNATTTTDKLRWDGKDSEGKPFESVHI